MNEKEERNTQVIITKIFIILSIIITLAILIISLLHMNEFLALGLSATGWLVIVVFGIVRLIQSLKNKTVKKEIVEHILLVLLLLVLIALFLENSGMWEISL